MLNILSIKGIALSIACLLLTQSVAAAQKNSMADAAKYIQLQTASKQNFSAYVAGQKNAKQGLLLIHGWWGLNREVETWANKYAVAGYRVMAIDLYNQQTTSHPVKARALMSKVKQSVTNEKYAAAIDALTAPNRKLAIIGRSYGANQAIHAAMVAQEKVSATIVYYPFKKVLTDTKMLSAIKTPILGHFAQHDYFFTPDMLTQFTTSIKKSGLAMTVNMYNAKHAFTNPVGKNFNETAQMLSLKRTRQFLSKYLN